MLFPNPPFLPKSLGSSTCLCAGLLPQTLAPRLGSIPTREGPVGEAESKQLPLRSVIFARMKLAVVLGCLQGNLFRLWSSKKSVKKGHLSRFTAAAPRRFGTRDRFCGLPCPASGLVIWRLLVTLLRATTSAAYWVEGSLQGIEGLNDGVQPRLIQGLRRRDG